MCNEAQINASSIVTVADVIAFLNSLLELDRQAVTDLLNSRVKCNEAIANHPTVQVKKLVVDEKPIYKVGFLGILNGLFGSIKSPNKYIDGFGYIACNIGEDGLIEKFGETVELKKEWELNHGKL